MIPITADKSLLGYGSLAACPNIFHFVTARRGGCSEGNYASFNCSPYTGDERSCVQRNQALLRERAGRPIKELVIPRQVHGVECLLVDERYVSLPALQRQELLQGVDALATVLPGYCLCVSTADCIPVLLYDRRRGAVAAVHAGWRGTVRRIVQRVLQQMAVAFDTCGADVLAAIGPGISLQAFEVGEEVYEAFRTEGFDMPRISCWNNATGKHHIDLWEANRLQLLDSGVPEGQIEMAGICTYGHWQEFFSARRMGTESGRMLSGIMLGELLRNAGNGR